MSPSPRKGKTSGISISELLGKEKAKKKAQIILYGCAGPGV
jgi:hypothetical protein